MTDWILIAAFSFFFGLPSLLGLWYVLWIIFRKR